MLDLVGNHEDGFSHDPAHQQIPSLIKLCFRQGCSLGTSKLESKKQVKGKMSRITRRPCLGVSYRVRHKPCCTMTEDGYRLEISDLQSRLCSENKVADQLHSNCAADLHLCFPISRFSHDVAQVMCM